MLKLLRKMIWGYKNPIHNNRTIISFISEDVAKAINFSDSPSDTVDRISEKVNKLQGSIRKLSIVNNIILVVLFLAIYEYNLVIRVSGIEVSNISATYEILLFVSATLSLFSAPLNVKSEYLKIGIIHYYKYFACHKERYKYFIYADHWQSISTVINRANFRAPSYPLFWGGLIVLITYVIPFLVVLGLMFFVHLSAVLYVMESSAWPDIWINALIMWVIWIDILTFIVVIVTSVKFPFCDQEVIDRLVAAQRRSNTERDFEIDRIFREHRKEKSRRRFRGHLDKCVGLAPSRR